MTVPLGLLLFFLFVFSFSVLYAACVRLHVHILRKKLTDSYNQGAETRRFLDIFAKNIGSAQDLEDSMNTTARYVADLIDAQGVCIYTENGGYLQAAGHYGTFPSFSAPRKNDYVLTKQKYIQEDLHNEKIKIGEGFLGEIAENREELLITGPEEDPRLAAFSGALVPIRTLMVVPLINSGKLTGIICAVNSRNMEQPFTSEQYGRFKFIASQVVLAQNIVQVYSSLSQQQRISQELEFARNLQLSLIPKNFPAWGDFTIQAFTRAAKEVSGDFYDFVKIDENRLLVVIGDACGKGIPACMIMAMTRAFIRSQINRFTTLKDLLRELNENIYRDTVDERYITLGCCLLNKRDATIEYARAGHTPLLMFLRKHIRAINPDGSGLGILPGELAEFDTLCTEASHNTTMLMFTDGINETTNSKDEFFGIPRLTSVYREACLAELEPTEIINRIIEATDQYSEQKKEQDDDQTMVIIRYK